MKTHASLPHLVICCGVALLSPTMHAQDPSATEDSAVITTMNDAVQADLHSPADKETTSPFHRTATLGADRMYAVVITYPDGRPRMKGSYQDPELNIPDGDFTYYYANGQVESFGTYDHGYKTGTWKCFTADGAPRADRVYHGMDWDDMQVLVGLAERAPTLAAASGNAAVFEGSGH